ncbi:MAG: PD-(D/E)XK nuclease family protein [Dehalococcoidia bacterium]
MTAELLRRTTLGLIDSGAAARFAPIADTPGLHELVGAAVDELAAADVDAAVFEETANRTPSLDLAALASIYSAYRRALDARGWHDAREAPTQAAAAIREDAALPTLVLIDSFEFLGPREVNLVAALAERTDVLVALDVAGGARAQWTGDQLEAHLPALTRLDLPARQIGERISTHLALDSEGQLRGIARVIKQTLADEPELRPSDVAVVFRQVSPHLALARRVFKEFDLPLDPAAGERLTARPLGAWLLGLLRLPAHDWRLTRLAELLRSPFLDQRPWGVEVDTVDHVMRVGRQHRLVSGLDDLFELPRALELEAERADDSGQGRFAARLRAAGSALERITASLTGLLLAPPMTMGAWSGALGEVLFGQDGLLEGSAARIDTFDVEVDALRAELGALLAIDEALGNEPVTLAAFTREIEARLERPGALLREAGGVLLAPMHTLHGLRFSHVFIADLVEGAFPAPRRAVGLLDAGARILLEGEGLELPPEARAREAELWQTASSRADVATSLWRPRLDASGRPHAASFYFDATAVVPRDEAGLQAPELAASRPELAIALAARWRRGERRRPAGLEAWGLVVRTSAPIEQRRRSFGDAGPHEGMLAGAELGWLTGPDVRWSASRLEAYRTCGFQFFGRYGLRLSELDDDIAEADAAVRGTVIHEVLEDALAPLAQEGRGLLPSTVPETVDRLRTSGRRIWDSAPERHAFGRGALWRFGWDDVADGLARLLWHEAELNATLGVTRVVRQELPIDVTLPGIEPPMRLVGSIDRVDAGDGVTQVVDYKSGRPIRRSDVESGQRLQLQLYALAAQVQLGASRLIARYAYLDPRAEAWSLDSASAGDEAIIEAARRHAAAARASIAAGDFRVNPSVDPCPSYCDFRHVCRVSQFTRFKQWS